MPSKWTFEIIPIRQFVHKYINDNVWIDPFAGFNSPANITNDLNTDAPTDYHLEAEDFMKTVEPDFYGCIFDPPYSLVQVSKSYASLGLRFYGKANPTGSFPRVRNIISEKIQIGGIVLHFGWNSNGFGKGRNFEILEILLVAHGGNRNDTICMAERKVSKQLKI